MLCWWDRTAFQLGPLEVGMTRRRLSSDGGLSTSSTSLAKANASDPEHVSQITGMSVEKQLQKENSDLKKQLEDLRAQYQQLLEEGKEETLEERRVNLLKAQVMQLERQVVLLSEGLSAQVCRCHDVERALDPLVDKLRSLLCSESPGPEVCIQQCELTQLLERCADVRQKLHRKVKATTVEDLSMPWVLTKSNLVKQPVTLLDLCYGKTNNLNLQRVSALESRLCQLFKHLHGIRQTLSLVLAPGSGEEAPLVPPGRGPSALYARLLNQAASCVPELDGCCSDLLILSLLVPTAPWVGSEQQVSLELRPEEVLASLPAFPRGAPQQRARRAAEALCRASNHAQLMALQQVEALQAELEFHRSLYSLQVTYTEELIQGVRRSYQAFQDSVTHSLCVPLQDVLSCYADLRSSASEEALRHFLTAFKSNAMCIQEAVEALDPSKSRGAEALSRYGEEFLAAVERILGECGQRRERAAGRLQDLRLEQEQALELLSGLSLERQERRARRQAGGSQGPRRGSEWPARGLDGSGRGSEGPGRSGDAGRRGSGEQERGQTPKGRILGEQECVVEGQEGSLEQHVGLGLPSRMLEQQETSVEQQENCSLEQQDSSSEKHGGTPVPVQSSTSDRQERARSVGRRGSAGSDKVVSGRQPASLTASAKQRALKKALSMDMTADTGPQRSPAQPTGVIQRPARSAPRKLPPMELSGRPEWQS
ncbi:uncharacterized protein LOC125294805 isoform X1 [Alosa alosa]|uniref:uncharacterized protein LOC125294805 isoform X1 n=1 Tax=Alosa alosa TaxID=278164 RepID=UPI0020153591|nr:uncharacterized protein LOC125294805 isoform X1 [Alosa alosa]